MASATGSFRPRFTNARIVDWLDARIGWSTPTHETRLEALRYRLPRSGLRQRALCYPRHTFRGRVLANLSPKPTLAQCA